MKWLNIVWVCALVATLTCCSKDDYLKYDTNMASVRFVYTADCDSLVYSFGLHPEIGDGESGLVEIPLQLIGTTWHQNRIVDIEVMQDGTTATSEDYNIESCEIPADQITGTLKVRLHKTERVKGEDVTIALKLVSNENFTAAPVNSDIFRIVVTNELTTPNGWIFGDYSRVKHEFVILHTGVATDYDQWSASEQIHWKGVLINALYEYNKAHPGDPLKDEHGMVITF